MYLKIDDDLKNELQVEASELRLSLTSYIRLLLATRHDK